MTTYIVREGEKLFIYQIGEDDKAAFLKRFAGNILVEGDGIHDVLGKFNRFPVILSAPE